MKLVDRATLRVEEPVLRPAPRRFWLVRQEDPSGVSGIGTVAEGAVFSDARVVLSWLTHGGSLGIYSSMESLEEIHGHGGKTQVVWIDRGGL